MGRVAASLLFLVCIIKMTSASGRFRLPVLPLLVAVLSAVYYLEANGVPDPHSPHWATALIESVALLSAGWILWRARASREGHGVELLAGVLFASGLHGLDRPLWPESPVFMLRLAFDDLLGVALGIAMIVLVLRERSFAHRRVERQDAQADAADRREYTKPFRPRSA